MVMMMNINQLNIQIREEDARKRSKNYVKIDLRDVIYLWLVKEFCRLMRLDKAR